MTLAQKLEQGIAAAEAGRKGEARALLTEVVDSDQAQTEAWWWLSHVSDGMEDKLICFENILALEPDHPEAQAALAWVQEQREKLYRSVYAPGEELPPANVISRPANATPPFSQDYPHQDEFDNPWLCPYCLSLTQPADITCPHCKSPLVLTTRIQTERSIWLWRGITLQLGMILIGGAIWATTFTLGLKYGGLGKPLSLLPLYFGLSMGQPPELVETVFLRYPPWLFWSFAGVVLYSSLMIAMLWFRMKHGNTVYLVSAGLLLAIGLLAILFYYGSFMGTTLGFLIVALGAGQLLVTLNLWNDFNFKSYRLRTEVDSGAKNHATFYLAGRQYAEAGLWGLAVIHYRRAVSREPHQAIYHLSLAVAYAKTNRLNLAQDSISAAEKLDPDAPEIWEVYRQLFPKTVKPLKKNLPK
jgi:tetratricopeptide (TPR) repeat protein